MVQLKLFSGGSGARGPNSQPKGLQRHEQILLVLAADNAPDGQLLVHKRKGGRKGWYFLHADKKRLEVRAYLGTQVQFPPCTFSSVHLGEFCVNEDAGKPSTRSRHCLSPV